MSANKRKCSAKTWGEYGPDMATEQLGEVFAEPGVVTAGASQSVTRVQDYIEVPIVAIKAEYGDEEKIPTQNSHWTYMHQRNDPISNIVKQKHDFVMQTEEGKFYEVKIKKELDIGPTMLPLEPASCSLLPSNKVDPCFGCLQLKLPKQEPDLSNMSRKVLKTLSQRGKKHRDHEKSNQVKTCHDSDEEADSKKMIKTPAQRSKEYRERKKLRQEANSKKVVKTPAQRSKEYRERKKLRQALAACDETTNSKKVRKTPAQCSKEYRERKKIRQAAAAGDEKAASRKVIKTPAQRSKEYRERKKLRQAHSGDKESNSRKMRKTPAQYSREYRERKQLRLAITSTFDDEETTLSEIIKTAAQRSKEYGQRKKYIKRLQLMKISRDVTTRDSTCFVLSKDDLKKKKDKLSHKLDRDEKDFIEIHCLPLTNINEAEVSLSQEIVKADPDQITANEIAVTVGDVAGETAKYSNYHQHANGHLDFFDIFTSNTFGHSCAVCDRLSWEKDLKDTTPSHESILKTILPDYVAGTRVKVCSTCKVALDRQKIPTLSTYNGFSYPIIPSHLPALDFVSQRFISPRIPFTQITRLRHVSGQDGIYGQIINIPLSIDTMVHRLPRNIDDDHSLYVHLEKKWIRNTSYVHKLVNKEKIKKWLTYLVQTPLYVHHNIKVNEEFFNSDGVDSNVNIDDFSEPISIGENIAAQQQTLLWNKDRFLHTVSRERNNAVSVLFDEHAEELSFPTIFCGQFRKYREDISVTSFMQAASELRRTDRRGADPQHLLYVATKIMRQRVRAGVNVALKHIGNNSKIPKNQIQSNIANYIDICIETNLAFLRCIPNSTWYLAEHEKDLLATIRQRGAPTAFMSLSANETGWTDLLKLLYRLKNKGKEISTDCLSPMSCADKAKLVNEDAVTCAIYFNRLVNCLLHVLQYKKRSPLGRYRVVDYFKKIEFQHGGCPHARILLWLDGAPKNLYDNTESTPMVDELVSVSASEASGYIELQTHEHSFACYKQTDRLHEQNCKYGAPFMPSRASITLLPMTKDDGEHSEEQYKKFEQHYKLIRANLENVDYTDFEQFYTHNGIESDEHYYNILRAGIDRPKLFYKRTPSEKWHIPFNPFVLHHLKSRMDFQIIEDEQACAAYIVEYVNRADKGVGDFRRRLIEMINENPDLDVAKMMKKVDVDLIGSVEMSVQEAAWYLLREPMAKSTMVTAYIPTIHPVERQRIRKTMRELNATDEDCADIWKENWFDKYERRPEKLQDVTLAQFVSKYYENKKGEYVNRNIPRVIRYRNYNATANTDDYKREMVLLHCPFRSEENDVLAEKKYCQIYEENEDLISQRRKELESKSDIEGIVEMYRHVSCGEDENKDD